VVEFPPDWEFWSPEMQESYLQAQQTSQGPVVNYVLPAIGALIFALAWMGDLRGNHAIGFDIAGRTRLDAKRVEHRCLGECSVHCSRSTARRFFMLIAGHEIASPGLSGFVQQGFMYHFLSRTDIFLFWNIALLGHRLLRWWTACQKAKH
jgi:hypothetical protein